MNPLTYVLLEDDRFMTTFNMLSQDLTLQFLKI